jgi:hypothetical protein
MTGARALLTSGKTVSYATLPGRRSLFRTRHWEPGGMQQREDKKTRKNSAEGRVGGQKHTRQIEQSWCVEEEDCRTDKVGKTRLYTSSGTRNKLVSPNT